MNHKVLAAIGQYQMLKQGDTVTAAVSGGADSVALLDFLSSLYDWHLTVRACHLNHCLRGAESDRDEQLVRTMCLEYGIPLEVRRVDVRGLAKQTGLSLETAARQVRYAFFEEQARKFGGRVATAHTLSDTAETVLLNLARGTGITGLCGIPPVRGIYIRPFIGCTRQEIEQYCADHGLCYVTDSTNLQDDYTRNYIRHHLIPGLDRINPEALEAIGRMTGLLRMDGDYLEQAAGTAEADLMEEGGLRIEGLLELHPALRSRLLTAQLRSCGIERSAERIAAMEKLLRGRNRPNRLQISGSWYCVTDGKILKMERKRRPAQGIQPQMLSKEKLDGFKIQFWQGKVLEFSVINCADYEISDNIDEIPLKYVADYDKIKNDVFLRSRQAGDRIRLAGRGCTKTLKKLYNELAVSEREHRCVLADHEGVFFAECAGMDERVAPTAETKRLLILIIAQT